MMNNNSRIMHLIAVLSIALALLGVVMVYSSSAFQMKRSPQLTLPDPEQERVDVVPPPLPLIPSHRAGAYSTLLFFAKQLTWLGLALAAMFMASRVDYPRWQKWAVPFTLLALILLLMVLSPLGSKRSGATSWLSFGRFTIQPAEFAKLALIIFLADLFSRRQQELKNSLLRTLVLFAVPVLVVGLVILQPDLGMAMLMVMVIGGLWFLAGAPVRHLVIILVLGASVLITVAFYNANAWNRIRTFWNPAEASPASRYQIEQSRIAITNGGLWGVGLGDGQQKMHFLPAPHTDFIFAVMAEELGLIFTLVVLAAYGALFVLGFLVALRTPDLFGTLLAGGVTLMMAAGVLVNIAVVTGSMPTTGLPLPLISYGGSSLISSMIGLGILLNISKNIGGVRKV